MPSLRQIAREASNLLPREPLEAASSVVENVVAQIVEAPSKVMKRQSSTTSTSSSSTHTCAAGDNSAGCQKPVSDSNLTVPIVLATVIPLFFALVVFFFLHRRHVKRLRLEDANDKHKSLDFGLDNVNGKAGKGAKGKKGRPEKSPDMMTLQDTHDVIKSARGMSMDMSSPNPYLLPPGLQASRESIHSLSRSTLPNDDRYRPATVFYPDGSATPSLRHDDSSSFTGSSRRGFPMNESRQNLIGNAYRSDRSMPPTQRNSIDSNNNGTFTPANGSQTTLPRKPSMPLPSQNERLSRIDQDSPIDFGFGNNVAPTMPEPVASPVMTRERTSPPPPPPKSAEQEESTQRKSPPPVLAGLPSNPRPKREVPRASSPITVPNVSPFISQDDEMMDQEPQLPQINIEDTHQQFDDRMPFQAQHQDDAHYNQGDWEAAENIQAQQYEQDFGYDIRRLTMGIRPLPPDDPSENAEQRANRIRSFYKEYFDDSTPMPRHHQADYYDDHSAAELVAYDAPIYDPDSGQFITGHTPYAEPITRRAMTPPPQGPPRFRPGGRGAAPSSGSDGFSRGYGARAFSSASAGGRFAAPRQQQKKKLPTPEPLAVLPTPHMLKDDTFIPMDFAPPQSYKSRQRGTPPDSPKGGFRPYSPSLKPHKALVSSFDDLAMLPSPHALRKSATFTSLDFAPPPRFRDDGTASDSGSIRSNRSGVSQRNLHAIRNGAYRLSRVPAGQVGTTADFAQALKPNWDMR